MASVWCGLSLSPGQLIVARALQGVGAALLVPNSLAIIVAFFEEERRRGKKIRARGIYRDLVCSNRGPFVTASAEVHRERVVRC